MKWRVHNYVQYLSSNGYSIDKIRFFFREYFGILFSEAQIQRLKLKNFNANLEFSKSDLPLQIKRFIASTEKSDLVNSEKQFSHQQEDQRHTIIDQINTSASFDLHITESTLESKLFDNPEFSIFDLDLSSFQKQKILDLLKQEDMRLGTRETRIFKENIILRLKLKS
jgi:hypothetical protein